MTFLIIHRFCASWSSDPSAIETLIKAAAKSKKVVKNPKFSISSSTKAPQTESWSHHQQQYLRSSNVPHLLSLISKEMSTRVEVVAFIRVICAGISMESISHDIGVADLCGKVVEPICRRLEAAASGLSHSFPSLLRIALVAVAKEDSAGLRPVDLLADCIIPNVKSFLMDAGGLDIRNNMADLEDDQLSSTAYNHLLAATSRIIDLLCLCLDQIPSKNLNLCLSDTAALSRSKWFVARCIEVAVQDTDHGVQNRHSPSPIAKLAQLNPSTGRSMWANQCICLRPSELLFIIRCVNINSAIAYPFEVPSRTLNEAFTALYHSEFQSRFEKYCISNSAYLPVSKTLPSNSLSIDRMTTFLFSQKINIHSVGDDPFESIISPGTLTAVASEQREDLLTMWQVEFSGASHQAVEISDGLNELSSLQWLISAARSALHAVYETTSQRYGGNIAAIRELNELSDALSSRRQVIQATLRDWQRLSIHKDLSANYQQQLLLLKEAYRVMLQFDDMPAMQVLPSSRGDSLSQKIHHALPLPLSVSSLPCSKLPSSEASLQNFRAKLREDFDEALANLLDNQNKIESQLLSKLAATFISSSLSASSFGNANARGRMASPTSSSHNKPSASWKAHGDSNDSQPKESIQQAMMSQPLPAVGGMNPLWIVMKDVFQQQPPAPPAAATASKHRKH